VSYAILRPPHDTSSCKSRRKEYPVLVNLHGAGLEADTEQVRHMLDDIPLLCAWLLFPSGVTSWSGDDWRKSLLTLKFAADYPVDNWGFSDVQAAIDALPSWIGCMGWSGVGVSTSDWLVSGHSNGGMYSQRLELS
jgi:hypothetical protein